MSEILTGGCQCGAVRFAVEAPLGRASICHCRMCQKATGSFFGAFVSGPNLRWTRGAPTRFREQGCPRLLRGLWHAADLRVGKAAAGTEHRRLRRSDPHSSRHPDGHG